MNTVVLVLCAGGNKGDFSTPKQLLDMGGEKLLARIVRQAFAHWDNVYVVAEDCRFWTETSAGNILTDHVAGGVDTVMGIHATWADADRLVVLLGDVYYTDHLMRGIALNVQPIAFWDMGGMEILALSFYRPAFPDLVSHARWVVQAAHGNSAAGGFQALWSRLHSHGVKPVMVSVRDASQDFDSVADYEEFKKGKSKNRLFET